LIGAAGLVTLGDTSLTFLGVYLVLRIGLDVFKSMLFIGTHFLASSFFAKAVGCGFFLGTIVL